MRNLRSTLPARIRRAPMAEFDRLPPDLRRWLAQAALPWSAASALRLWRRALTEGGDPMLALARLDRAERATLARDRLSTPD
jgi:hypothetical protein